MEPRHYIEFQDVSFQYPNSEDWALKGVSFHIKPNEWVAIIGHNGSGKSTIAKLMNGLLSPQQGTIHVQELPINQETIWDVRKKVGMVFQNPDNQFVGTTVIDDVAFGLENHGIPREDMQKRISYSLKAVNMEEYVNHEPHNLSGGQKQRVAIASVLAVEPELIILDEATAMLDPKGRNSIMNTVHQVRQDRDVSVVTITHDLNEVLFADRVIVMNEGNVWFEGTPREVFQKHDELQAIGLDTPFVTQLSRHLNKLGISLHKEPLTHKDLMDELWTLHSTR
ncbi:energy-coupling factor ABC transporter ATP-binding protein [Salinibacillus xinjiangensis]|uniref:Energy-coupling factor ABC transporter ATP-binding protein n=1 Tax=Salinibacillus xinjiangensis TaxID=1229268 RepID=A0A6G1XAW0_9BACI|nr:energy-coupling factor ABC transporter ATP-binding protein [Salinibacillus xinjiangensis]MRG88045.1 energy-coupling factor ABC transporter ATP-binding protein [Salinibacillus xinjiangensis]